MPTPGEIQTCINNLTSSSDITEMVVLAAQTNDVTVDRSIPVAETCDLPDLATSGVSVGTVLFVQSLCIPVVAGVGCWMTLDNPGRIVRQDYAAGEIWSWGRNCFGELGTNDATATSRSSPVSVVGGFTDWCQISAGVSSVAAIRTNGTAWAWGCNNCGQIGDNTTVSKSSPVSVVGGYTDWCQISIACEHTLAVRQNGTLWAWGSGEAGRLGNNCTTNRSSPVSVVGGFTDWSKVAAFQRGGIGLRQNGTIWAWGYNTQGALGDNTTVSKSSPVSVVGGFTDWCHISANRLGNSNRNWAIAIRTNGTAWAWGSNNTGQLGDNTTVSKSSPVSVVGGFTNWCQIEAGSAGGTSVGVRQNGSAWAWGYNVFGQLGDNTTVSKLSPVSIVGGFTDWCQLSGGRYHSTGVRQNGTAWTWGNNGRGQLGNNTTAAASSPVSVVGGFTDWCQVSAGAYFQVSIRKY